MRAEVCYAMDVGPRANQQDCILAGCQVVQESDAFFRGFVEGDSLVFAVCDGLGGHSKGEAASRFICEQMLAWKDRAPRDGDPLDEAVRRIQHAAEAGALEEDSGATLAGLLLCDHSATAFNAGDSRVYGVGKSRIERLSHDHSFVQRLVDGKLITKKEAFENPFRNLVDFGLGLLFADRWAGQYSMFQKRTGLRAGDVFLLCTDGVSDVLTDEEIRAVLADRPMEKAEALVSAIRERGLRDNMSLVMVKTA
ncbi:MAG: PP2C family serine/threonine-protein phosphatase [Thermodesulfobacteriota bacterium]